MKQISFKLLLSIIVLSSCNINSKLEGIYNYEGSSNGFSKQYVLKLEKKSFELHYYSKDASPECYSNFMVSGDSLFLKCYPEKSFIKTINSGYMNKREYKIKIIDTRTLRLIDENILLKK